MHRRTPTYWSSEQDRPGSCWPTSWRVKAYACSSSIGTLGDSRTGAKIDREAGGVRVGYGFESVQFSSAVEYRVDKTGVIHVPVGKVSFTSDKITANAKALIDAVIKAKPATAKGKYVKKVNVATTMGPGILVDPTSVGA